MITKQTEGKKDTDRNPVIVTVTDWVIESRSV